MGRDGGENEGRIGPRRDRSGKPAFVQGLQDAKKVGASALACPRMASPLRDFPAPLRAKPGGG